MNCPNGHELQNFVLHCGIITIMKRKAFQFMRQRRNLLSASENSCAQAQFILKERLAMTSNNNLIKAKNKTV